VGRPYIYGLAKSGQEGVEAVLRALLADLDISLGLVGYSSITELHHKAEEMLVHERE
jgi:lactate 2-monooxygenase